MNEVLTVSETATLLDCSEDQVQLLARQKQLPALKFGRDWIFPRNALLLALNNKALENIAPIAANDAVVPTGVQPRPPVQRRQEPPKLGLVPPVEKEPA